MTRPSLIAIAPLLLPVFISSASANQNTRVPQASSNVCEREMLRASQQHRVPVNVLYAVSLTETGRRGKLDPHAINVEGKSVFSPNVNEAMRQVELARSKGAKLIDIGCMQINHYFHGKKFASVAEMFNPTKNVDYGARFLIELKQREGSWTMAVARYHAGPNNTSAQKRYVCAVIGNMVSSGLGAWTDNARSFCKPAG
ncbi:MAG: transglycosylase SLT domain-containing protein [Beijerinckiaceae bacterium]|jgi:soluble lytic murein transglycosylase-like protein|nr:transglycosylase SLT domain-containing protein [Beijerinckiaceae bacterium]